MTLTIKDETVTGDIIREIDLIFISENITVKELITQRVLQEVALYNSKLPDYYNGLIEPTDAEKTLNGFKIHNNRTIDGEKQVYTALDAFMKNGYFVLIDNLQAETLEQQVKISKNTKVSFIKLTPLVGG